MRPWIWCLVAAALFGASTPAAKGLLSSLSGGTAVEPLVLAGLLYLGAALGALPFAFRGGSWVAARRPRNLRRVLAIIVFGGVLGPAFLLEGLARAPSADVSLWLNLETVATAVVGWAFFHETITRKTLAAIVLVTIAVALVAGLPTDRGALVPAALLVAAACACWGIDNNVSSLIDGLTPAQSTVIKGIAAGSFNVVVGLARSQDVAVPAEGEIIALALVVGALGYGLSIALYVRGAQHLGAVRAQMAFATAPFFGAVLAWLALSEQVTAAQLVGGALMIGALAVLRRDTHAHEHAHETVTHTHWHRHDDGHHEHEHGHGHGHGHEQDGWHVHEHSHEQMVHAHDHRSDVHHRHPHRHRPPHQPPS